MTITASASASADFESLVNETFHVAVAPYAATVSLHLDSVTRHTPSGSPMQSISLLFSGPLDPHVPQDSYYLLHPAMQPTLFFIVPIQRSADGYKYEVIINTLTPNPTAQIKELDS